MSKGIFCVAAALALSCGFAAEPAAKAVISVDFAQELGPIRDMNSVNGGPKKYGVLPPKDFAKWARICEHVIRHYNEGWGWATDTAYTTKNIAWSNQFNIAYWEIWNEPDLDPSDDPNALPRRARCHMTDAVRIYTEVPLVRTADGSYLIRMQPNSFTLVEWCPGARHARVREFAII